MQYFIFLCLNDLQPVQHIERVQSIRRPKFGIMLPMEQLLVLDGIFDIDNASSAVLDIYLAWLHQLPHLAPSKMQCVLPIPRSIAVRERVTMRFNSTAQPLIPRNPSQLDEGLPFIRESLAAETVVPLKLVEGDRPRAGIAIRPKPEVDLKDAFVTRLNTFDHSACERFENRTGDAFGLLVDEKQLQVRGITHLASAEFAESADRESSACGTGDVFEAHVNGFVDHHFRQVGERFGEVDQCGTRIQQMLRIGNEELIVLESVKRTFFVIKCRRCAQTITEVVAKRVLA